MYIRSPLSPISQFLFFSTPFRFKLSPNSPSLSSSSLTNIYTNRRCHNRLRFLRSLCRYTEINRIWKHSWRWCHHESWFHCCYPHICTHRQKTDVLHVVLATIPVIVQDTLLCLFHFSYTPSLLFTTPFIPHASSFSFFSAHYSSGSTPSSLNDALMASNFTGPTLENLSFCLRLHIFPRLRLPSLFPLYCSIHLFTIPASLSLYSIHSFALPLHLPTPFALPLCYVSNFSQLFPLPSPIQPISSSILFASHPLVYTTFFSHFPSYVRKHSPTIQWCHCELL